MKLKYGNKKIEHMGYSFASGAEASLFDYLKKLESLGEVRNIKCQDTIYLTQSRIMYKPDFKFEHLVGDKWVIKWAEMKGVELPPWRIKRRLWKNYGPGPLQIYKPSNRGPYFVEEIVPPDAAVNV